MFQNLATAYQADERFNSLFVHVCFICSLLDPDLCISWWQIYSGKKVDLVSVSIAVNNYFKNCSVLEMHSAIAPCNTYAH